MDEVAIIGLLATILTMSIAIITPLMKLNGTLSKLNENIISMKTDVERNDHRLNVHSERLDKLETTVTTHDVEIKNLSRYHYKN